MSEKTEQPTSKRIQDSRKKGQVAKSRDFTQTLLIVALFGHTLVNGRLIAGQLGELLFLPGRYVGQATHSMSVVATECLLTGTKVLLPYLLIVLVIGIFSESLQSGFLIAPEAIKPKLDKLNAAQNLKQMFSAKNLVEFIKSIVKVTALSMICYLIVRGLLPSLVLTVYGNTSQIGSVLFIGFKQLIIYSGLAFAVVGLADLWWQRRAYRKQLMMSKEEVKQEYKEMEGDPYVKSARKHLLQEIVMSNNDDRVRKASVLVTNPVHLAIALYYQPDETPLPVVTAKGENLWAQRMVEVARQAGVPVLENLPLAHALNHRAALDQYIPSELVEPVALLLRELKNLRALDGFPS